MNAYGDQKMSVGQRAKWEVFLNRTFTVGDAVTAVNPQSGEIEAGTIYGYGDTDPIVDFSDTRGETEVFTLNGVEL